eukprot:78411-Amphidinium_carterae.2
MDTLDRFYAFIDGPEISKRSPPPALVVMMRAERAAWRRISIALHEGSSLTDAIIKIQSDSLFWVREVYEHIRVLPPSIQPQVKRARNLPSSSSLTPKMDTSRWAAHDSAGVEICRNFHFGICKLTPEACRRSHVCPITKDDGSTCGGAHRAGNCPHLSSA